MWIVSNSAHADNWNQWKHKNLSGLSLRKQNLSSTQQTQQVKL